MSGLLLLYILLDKDLHCATLILYEYLYLILLIPVHIAATIAIYYFNACYCSCINDNSVLVHYSKVAIFYFFSFGS